MKMTYEEYVDMIGDLDNRTEEEVNFFFHIESIADRVHYFMRKEDMTIEQAQAKVKEMTKANDNEMELAIAGVKEQLALFKVCEAKGHDFKSESGELPIENYTRMICKRCGYINGTVHYPES